jgi:hypothetical protein
VYSLEVFSAAEAAEVFGKYHEIGQVRDTLPVRPLSL